METLDAKKPLIRWTVGPVHDCGFDVLAESVRRAKELYPEFDLVVCYNNLSVQQLERIKRLDVELVDQAAHVDSLPTHPQDGYFVGWKLYPPRLRAAAHELFVDNDIVLCKRAGDIERWLTSSNTLLYQGLHGLHGAYSERIPKGIRINSGIFGLPPNYDFAEALSRDIGEWQDYFDEQGLVGHVLLQKRHQIIPLTTVPIVEHDWPLDAHDNNVGCCGYHFVGANKREHPPFRQFVARQRWL